MKRRTVGALIVTGLFVLATASLREKTRHLPRTNEAATASTVGLDRPDIHNVNRADLTLQTNISEADPAASLPCADQRLHDNESPADLSRYERYKEEHRALARQVMASANAQDQLVGLQLLRGEEANQTQALADLLQQLPHNPLLATVLFDRCSADATVSACRTLDLRKILIEADGDNGGAWLRIASSYLVAGREEDALQALRRVGNAALHSNHYIEWAVITEQALRSAQGLDRQARFMYGFGLGAAGFPGYGPLVTGCTELGATSANWRQACIEAGNAMERGSPELLSMVIGQSLQRLAYEANGQPELADEVRARVDALDQRRKIMIRLSPEKFLDDRPAAFQEYIDTWASEGEVAAMDYAIDSVTQAVAQGDYIPCSISDPDPP